MKIRRATRTRPGIGRGRAVGGAAHWLSSGLDWMFGSWPRTARAAVLLSVVAASVIASAQMFDVEVHIWKVLILRPLMIE